MLVYVDRNGHRLAKRTVECAPAPAISAKFNGFLDHCGSQRDGTARWLTAQKMELRVGGRESFLPHQMASNLNCVVKTQCYIINTARNPPGGMIRSLAGVEVHAFAPVNKPHRTSPQT